jgi:hypothetical protein
VILSGNVSGEVDVEWLNSTAEVLEEVHTGVSIIAMTSGIQNITMAAPRLGEHFDGLAYTYEPNFENEPEFSWEFDPETIQNFEAVAQIGRTSKMKMIAYPTGRPVLQSYLWKYGWDYSLISGILDELIVETQTYCKDSAERYAEALRSLSDQHIARGMPRDFTSQITIAPGQPNTASVPTAIECVNEARKLGFDEILIWWSPSGAAEMMSLMQRLNR